MAVGNRHHGFPERVTVRLDESQRVQFGFSVTKFIGVAKLIGKSEQVAKRVGIAKFVGKSEYIVDDFKCHHCRHRKT